jgi:hypothetical protein
MGFRSYPQSLITNSTSASNFCTPGGAKSLGPIPFTPQSSPLDPQAWISPLSPASRAGLLIFSALTLGCLADSLSELSAHIGLGHVSIAEGHCKAFMTQHLANQTGNPPTFLPGGILFMPSAPGWSRRRRIQCHPCPLCLRGHPVFVSRNLHSRCAAAMLQRSAGLNPPAVQLGPNSCAPRVEAYLKQATHVIVLRYMRQRPGNSHGYAAHGVAPEQAHLDAPPEEGLKRPEMQVHAYRLHRLVQASRIALNAQGSRIAKAPESECPSKPLEGFCVSVHGAGRVVADMAAQEKCIERGWNPRFGVRTFFLGLFHRGKIPGRLDLIGLVETGGFEPPTPCVQSRCSPTELRPRAT